MSKKLYVTYGITLNKTYRAGHTYETEKAAFDEVMGRNYLEVQKFEENAGKVYFWQYKEIEVD